MRKNINFNVERSIVYFNDHKIILSGKNMKHNFKQLETFSNFEFDSLASALIEIVEQYMVERNSYSASPFYRLNLFYNRFKKEKMCKNHLVNFYGVLSKRVILMLKVVTKAKIIH